MNIPSQFIIITLHLFILFIVTIIYLIILRIFLTLRFRETIVSVTLATAPRILRSQAIITAIIAIARSIINWTANRVIITGTCNNQRFRWMFLQGMPCKLIVILNTLLLCIKCLLKLLKLLLRQDKLILNPRYFIFELNNSLILPY